MLSHDLVRAELSVEVIRDHFTSYGGDRELDSQIERQIQRVKAAVDAITPAPQ